MASVKQPSIMADNKKNSEFLGGGPKFNRVSARSSELEPTSVRPAAPPYRSRAVVIIIILAVLMGLLYAVTQHPSGITRAPARAGSGYAQSEPAPSGP